MYATKSLELTTRASNVLKVILKASDRITELEQKIHENERTAALFNEARLYYKVEQLTKRKNAASVAKDRLVKYYGGLVLRIVYNGLKQGVFEHLDEPSNTPKI
jgi:hypothetical protein